MRKLLILMLSLVTAATVAGVALAQGPTFDEVNAVAEKLNCPTCAGINLADCQTQTCAQWRDQIAELLGEGKTEAEVLDFFAAQYGDRVLQEPPRRGIALWVWVIPVIGLLVGGVWLTLLLRSWSAQRAAALAGSGATPAPAAGATDEAATDPYLHRVEQDLKDF